uniref:Uncharacterized protein n=1 Tax=Ascaris lumbricoides TaxID=6252 RepID=A0A0M3HZQ1_ASCLU
MDAPTLIGEKESTGGEKIRGKNISISHSKKQVEKPIRTSGTKYTLAGLSPDILFHKSHHHVDRDVDDSICVLASVFISNLLLLLSKLLPHQARWCDNWGKRRQTNPIMPQGHDGQSTA